MRIINAPILLLLVSGSIAGAQESPTNPDETPKSQRVQILDSSNDGLPRMGTNRTPIEPTEPLISKPHVAGLTEGQDWMQVVNNTIGLVNPPSVLAEGSFILARPGRLVPAPNDRMIFVPDPEQRLPGEGPVLLLPCSTLERLERIWANQPVTVSGEILSYHGRNHLLINDFTLGIQPVRVQPDVDAEARPTDDAPDTNPTIDEPGLDEDPDVLELLRELDADDPTSPTRATNPAINSPNNRILNHTPRASGSSDARLQTTPPALAPGLREGTLLIRRPARLDRASDGSWRAIFDNDELEAASGIELTMMPSSLLMTMEQQSIRFGDSARFVVSGRVYVHNNQGYLLPTFYQRLRTSDIKPWQ